MGTSQVFPEGEKEEAVMQSVFSEDFCIEKATQSGKLGFSQEMQTVSGRRHLFIYFHHNIPYKM